MHAVKLIKKVLILILIAYMIVSFFPLTGYEINSSRLTTVLILIFAFSGIIAWISTCIIGRNKSNTVKAILELFGRILLIIVISILFTIFNIWNNMSSHESTFSVNNKNYVAVDRSFLFGTDIKIYYDYGVIRRYSGMEIDTDDAYNPFIENEYNIEKMDNKYMLKYYYNGKNSGIEKQLIFE